MTENEREGDVEYLSLREVAEKYRVPLRQVKLAIKDGELTPATVGRAQVVRRELVVAWMRSREAAV